MSGIGISVVVPVHNGERVRGPCIELLLAMDYPRDAIEIIIVDNASTDGAAAIIQVALLRLIRLCVSAAFRVCLAVCPRQWLTLMPYKIFLGVSYDAAILRSRREQLR